MHAGVVDRTDWIQAPDGRMRVYRAHPASSGPVPAVLLIHDVLGLHEEIRGFVRTIAQGGYACFAPDLYYRAEFDEFRGQADSPRTRVLSRELMTEWLPADIRAVTAYIDACPEVRADPRKGCIGFCRGGGQALVAAGSVPEQYRGVVSVYGTRLMQNTPDTNWLHWAANVTGELLFLASGQDDLMPLDALEELERWLREHGKQYTIKIYPTAQHGWNFRSRPTFDPETDADTWARAFELWERVLG